jgi:hypothetical protein
MTTRAGLSAGTEIAEKATRRAANARQIRARAFSLRERLTLRLDRDSRAEGENSSEW